MLRSIHILGFHIPMYSLMLALAILSFLLLFRASLKKERESDAVTYRRCLFVACLSVAAVGVSAFVLNSVFHSIEEGRIVIGGITWLGGVVGGIPACLLLAHWLVPKKRGYELDLLDGMMPGMVLAHGLGRLGCFFGGCCYGGVTDSPLGVVFPEGSPAAKTYPNADGTGSLPVYPTQLFEAAFEIVFFAVLMLLCRKEKKKYTTALWCIGYAVFRFALEFLRGDDRGATGFLLSPSQLMSILLFVFGILLLLYRLGIGFSGLRAKMAVWQSEADALPISVLAPARGQQSDTDLLRELYELKEKGIITEEEYEAKKKEILARI